MEEKEKLTKIGLQVEQCMHCGRIEEVGDVTEGDKVLARMCIKCYEENVLGLKRVEGPREPDLF